MNSILTREPALSDFAASLLQESFFRDGTLTLYSDVPVPCISYTPLFHSCRSNPCSDKNRYRQVNMDLVICQEDAVLLAICFDEGESWHETMFATYFNGMEYFRCDLMHFTDTDLAHLYRQVTDKLHFYTAYQLTTENYTLSCVRIPEDRAFLEQKNFLSDTPMSLFYAQDCGLFFHCTRTEDGTYTQIPVTSQTMSSTFLGALHWQSTDTCSADTLRTALDTPLAALSLHSRSFLDLLEQARSAVKHRLAPPEQADPLTFRSCLDMLLHIDAALKKRDIAPDDENTLTYQRDAIVYALSGIAQAHTGVFQLPLRKYFEAAAAMTDCYYPVWLYLRNVQPHLCNQPEDSFCLADLLNVCQPYMLFSDRSSAVVPSLVTLLTAPVFS